MTSPVPPLLTEERPPLSRRKRVARFVVTLVLVAAIGSGVSWWWAGRDASNVGLSAVGTAYAAQTDTLSRAPKGVRVRVRVVNSTDINGLAKRATAMLRDYGFDVVEYETEKGRKTPRATTLVQAHTGHSDWSDRILRVLGTGTVEVRPDTTRYVDVSVLLGLDWKPTAQPFRP